MREEGIINAKSRNEWEQLIDDWIHNERDRAMLKRRLLDGICFEPLAEEFELSVNHCRDRVTKAKKQLFSHVK